MSLAAKPPHLKNASWIDLDECGVIWTLSPHLGRMVAPAAYDIHLFGTRCNSLKGNKNTSIPIKHVMGAPHLLRVLGALDIPQLGYIVVKWTMVTTGFSKMS